MCHVCQEQTVSVYQIKHVINQEKLRNSDTHGHMGHGISKAFPMAERGFTVYHTTPFSFRFALADTLPDGARTTIRLQEESTEREEGIGSISSPIGSLRLCLLLPPLAVRRVLRKGIS